MHRGRCLCGAVTYEIAGELGGIEFCHCSQCRRASGTAFASNMSVAAETFRVLTGEASLKTYASSPGKERVFCAECGSPIISRSRGGPSTVRVRVGTLDEPVAAKPVFNFHTDSKASWWTITDDLPRYPGPRPR
ncbi:MAG TPA: GFA family protein [Caulobacteraceae bacterium]|nr:GFA family protein [Caulobacteraceae bacterium]